MDTNRMQGGMIPGMASGMLGLEMPLHQNPQQQQQMMSFGPHDNDLHSQSQQPVMKQQPYHYNTKDKQQQQQQWSDEDEPGFNGDDGGGDGKKRTSPWQRMKWTDNMVTLLIMVVFYIGDDGGGEAIATATATATDPSGTGKKKSGGLLQKKGKWKTVSKAMMERGFYVSPQQCEDKFNDLNKRYKRVNDILGKGTACKVVENQSLLDTMDNISPKMKKEVKKLLNSKHLFFREMCAYHNTCAVSGGAAAFASAHHSAAEVAVEPAHHPSQQRCFHSSEANAILANSRGRADGEGLKVGRGGSREEEGDDEDDDDDDEDDDDEDEEEEEEETEESRGHKNHNGYRGAEEEVLGSRKRQRRGVFGSSASPSSLSPAMHQLSSELFSVLQDGTKSEWEQRQWMRNKLYQLEEQKVRYQHEAFELEKQRLKWIKFSGKKEREMEKTKLENDRMRLENERMVLLLRQKELELLDLQQQQQQHHQQLSSNRRPDPSSITG
ncbi:scaffold attachment factor B1 [Macadamia integrifolia]|uniref:scaffold attachment factor B1 n=1 Tax=Macadamia integrifolia TaxID=60698 RepID=UPI001C4F0460|nr:scaffold attachment factor B1 [Macadamia integrifolia]